MTRKRAAFSPGELGLLDAIHADPRNDALRLVYADWLDEHGESELGSFIRAEMLEENFAYQKPAHLKGGLVLHRGSFCSTESVVWEVRAEWFCPLPRPLKFWGFSRGLPTVGYWDRYSTLDNWTAVLHRVNPRVRLELDVADENCLAEHLAHPLMTRARLVSVYGRSQDEHSPSRPLGAEVATAIAESPHLDRLDALILKERPDAGVRSMLRNRVLPRVTIHPQAWLQD
jgi:uncharacterized protein (TIGR02996 family)